LITLVCPSLAETTPHEALKTALFDGAAAGPSCPGARRVKRREARSLSIAGTEIGELLRGAKQSAVSRCTRAIKFGTLSIRSVFRDFKLGSPALSGGSSAM
jgi:hypothetical protein